MLTNTNARNGIRFALRFAQVLGLTLVGVLAGTTNAQGTYVYNGDSFVLGYA